MISQTTRHRGNAARPREDRPLPRRFYRLAGEDSDLLFLRIKFHLEAGQFGEAMVALECAVLDLQAGKSIYSGFKSANDLPLALTRLNTDELGRLEAVGLLTVGQLLRRDPEALQELPGVGPTRLANAYEAAEELRIDYRLWRKSFRKNTKRREGPRSDSNASTRQGDSTVDQGPSDAAARGTGRD